MISERKRETRKITQVTIMTTLKNSTDRPVENISKFIINLWNTEEYTHSHFQSELEDLLEKKVNDELTESDNIRLTAYEKSFDFDVKYSIDSWWELDAPNSISVPTFDCESFEEAQEIMSGNSDPDEPIIEDIDLHSIIEFGNCEENELFVKVSNMEVKTND